MKASDRTILLVLPALALVVGFYLLAISPKQGEIGDLNDQITSLQGRIDTADDGVATAEEARKAFPRNYSEIVSMGSAVPEDSDQATLIYDLTKVSDESSVRFRSFELDEAAASVATTAPAAPAATTTTTATDSTTTGGTTDSTSSTTTAAVPVAATETSAAALPIGATVGSAGLPVMPYKLRFGGSFFNMADFFAALDKTVDVVDSGGDPEVRGRLMTVNGFAMVGDPVLGFPDVQASLSLNTYIVPAEQGLSDGASPAGPSPVADSTTVASADGTESVPGTAAVSP